MQIRVFSLILLLVLQPMLTSSSVFADTKSSLEDYNIENVVIKNEDSNLPEDTTFEIIKDETIFNIEIESQSEDEVLTQPILTIENETTSDNGVLHYVQTQLKVQKKNHLTPFDYLKN